MFLLICCILPCFLSITLINLTYMCCHSRMKWFHQHTRVRHRCLNDNQAVAVKCMKRSKTSNNRLTQLVALYPTWRPPNKLQEKRCILMTFVHMQVPTIGFVKKNVYLLFTPATVILCQFASLPVCQCIVSMYIRYL